MNKHTFERYGYGGLRDSGIPWLGDIPNHWGVKRLKDIGVSIIGITYSPEDVLDEEAKGILVLRSSNIQNNKLCLLDTVHVGIQISRKQTLRKGDILICSRNGSRSLIGKNIRIDERTEGQTFGAFMTIYRSKYSKYTQYFFNSNLFESQSGLYMSSTINQLTINTLNNFLITLPTIAEQQVITDYLDTKTAQIDHKIDLLSQKRIKYDELKRSLINEIVTRGLNKTVAMKDSGIEWIGEVPEHWQVARIADISLQNKGKNTGLVEKNLLSLSYGRVIRKDFNTSFGLLPESFETYQVVMAGTVILRLTDLQNDQKSLRVGLVREQGIITSAYLGLCFRRSINSIFAYYLLHVYDLSKVFYWFGGGLRSTMRFDDVRVIPFILPPLNEQVLIATYLDAKTAHIDRIIATINLQIDKLKELRKTIINDVVTGKIKVTVEGEAI